MDSFCGNCLPEPGQATRIVLPAARFMPVNIYRPRNISHVNQLLVCVHGISRNAQQQLEAYKGLSDRLGIWLIAPEFHKSTFPKYQQMAKNADDNRADLALNIFLLAWQKHFRIRKVRLHLCGYSGGAQFAHRYALIYPENITSLVLSSAGWYTFPDNAKYPRGLNKWPKWIRAPKLAEMLSIPLLVFVGGEDTERNKSLNTSPKIDLQQGLNRVERANNWIQAIIQQRKVLGILAPVWFQLLEGQGHDFGENIVESNMLSEIETFISVNLSVGS